MLTAKEFLKEHIIICTIPPTGEKEESRAETEKANFESKENTEEKE